MPEFIAAVIAHTRASARHSSSSARPKTAVYAGGRAAAELTCGTAGRRPTIEAGFAACHASIPARPPSSAAAKPFPLTVRT